MSTTSIPYYGSSIETRISRTFAEVVGPDKYSIHRHSCEFSQAEAELYRKLVEEFFKFKDYFESTGNRRKDAGLQAIRQLKLLIEGCSHPHLFPDYEGSGHAEKFQKVRQLLQEFQGEKVAIGILRKNVFGKDYLAHWVNYLSDLGRQIFVISGEISFSKRGQIIEAFQESKDGILLSTQGSLKSSVNIPACNRVIIPCLNWNMPKLAQYYFRFIRMDMLTPTEVHFRYLCQLYRRKPLGPTDQQRKTQRDCEEWGVCRLRKLDGILEPG